MPYIIQYAKSARSSCKGPKSCPNKKIEKGALRFGSIVDQEGREMTIWRHWSCVTDRILQNISSTDDLQGFETLTPEDQEKIAKAIHEKCTSEDVIEQKKESEEKEGGSKVLGTEATLETNTEGSVSSPDKKNKRKKKETQIPAEPTEGRKKKSKTEKKVTDKKKQSQVVTSQPLETTSSPVKEKKKRKTKTDPKDIPQKSV